MSGPLAGLEVIELATILAGPAVGMFFAEMGADVIKVEPLGGDPTRGWRAAGEESPEGLSAYFCSVNWGKRSVTLDLKSERATLRKLLRQADVLLVNFKPGDEARHGLDPDLLRRDYPRLLVGSVTGYGGQDPRPGFDVLIQAESGFMWMNGPTGGPPCRLPVALIDLMAAHQLKEGLLLALLERERTGRGRRVEVCLWKTALASLANQATNLLMAGLDPAPQGTEHPNLFPYGTLLPCRMGEVLVAVGTDRQFAELWRALGLGEVPAGFERNPDRVERREELRGLLAAASRRADRDELLGRLLGAGVPAGKLQPVSGALASPAGRELLLEHEAVQGLRTVAWEGFAPTPLGPPPRLGQHTREILARAGG